MIVILIALVIFVVALKKPAWGLGAALLVLPFHFYISSLESSEYYGIGALAVDAALAAVAAGLFCQRLKRRDVPRFQLEPKYLLGFLAYNLVLLLSESVTPYALGEFKWYALYPFISMLVANVLVEDSDLRTLSKALMLLTGMLGLLGILDTAAHELIADVFRYDAWSAGQGDFGSFVRAKGLQDNAVVYGGVMALLLLFILGTPAERLGGRLSLKPFALALGLGGLIVSFSGTAAATLIVGIGIFFGLGRSPRVALLLCAIAIAGFAIDTYALEGAYSTRLAILDSGSEARTSAAGRYQAVHIAMDHWSKRPILGWGLGTLSTPGYNPGVFDSLYLHLLITVGITGLIMQLAMLIGFVVKAFVARARTRDASTRQLLAALIAAGGATIVNGLVSADFVARTYNVLFWTMMGVLVALVRMDRKARTSAPGDGAKIASGTPHPEMRPIHSIPAAVTGASRRTDAVVS